ncbi:hypothetical protein, partial [Geomonas sp.]|uniref:hypothetical protein n=1 Tax=Geomonas sp. TaxID=2651584 RepID=UPI002B4819A2
MERNGKNILELNPHHHNHGRLGGIVDGEYGVHIEEFFQETLCLERKRSERSGLPFVLMRITFEREAAQQPA